MEKGKETVNKMVIILIGLMAIGTVRANAYEDITPEMVYQRIENGDNMLILDVRELYEYESGYIPGAINMPWNSGVLQNRYNELPTDKDIIVVCRSGNRSVSASLFLDGKGFEPVFNMLGGMLAWEWEVAVPGFGMHHPGPGWIYSNSNDTTFVHCFTDSMDWLEFPPGGMMHHHFPDSIYCEFEELHPDSVPWPHDSTMIGGYHIDITNPMGHGMMDGGMMGFQKNIGLYLHYNDSMLGEWLEEGMMLMYWDEDGSHWIDVPGTMHDIESNTISLTQNPLRSYYGLFAESATVKIGDVNSDGDINITDVVTIINFILGVNQPTVEQFLAADMDENGSINILDVLQVVNIILGTTPKHMGLGNEMENILNTQSFFFADNIGISVPFFKTHNSG